MQKFIKKWTPGCRGASICRKILKIKRECSRRSDHDPRPEFSSGSILPTYNRRPRPPKSNQNLQIP